MITTARKASELWCPATGLTKLCHASNCPVWEFWVPPPGTESEWARIHPPETDEDKKGYCGLTGKH